ncbi:MAG: glycosyltransferase family 1 protein [Acidobacteria bacterium]|nr:glycosyltransferase family 1 protein [Acidobacteriota bacterium]
MKIGIDASYSIDREPTGVGIYSRRLIAALAVQAPADEFTLCYRANRYLRSWREPIASNCRRALLEGLTLPGLTRRLDVFHGLNQRLPERRFQRAVSTFHDLFVMTSEYSTPDYRARFSGLAKQAVERSDRIAAVSAFTADQTAELLGFPRERIVVVPHGVDHMPQFSADQLTKFRQERGLQRPFLLNVGSLQERKNIRRLVEAFERVSNELLLVLAGSAGYGGDEIAAHIAASPARDRIILLGYVDDAAKAKLYRSAHALAFPSLDEGFGIPILEAMSAGLPVLTSSCSAMPEVAGDAAVLVEANDAEAIADGLRRIVEDQALRQLLRERGLARAAEFTWRQAADKMLTIYRELA